MFSQLFCVSKPFFASFDAALKRGNIFHLSVFELVTGRDEQYSSISNVKSYQKINF